MTNVSYICLIFLSYTTHTYYLHNTCCDTQLHNTRSPPKKHALRTLHRLETTLYKSFVKNTNHKSYILLLTKLCKLCIDSCGLVCFQTYFKLSTIGGRAFPVSASQIWNSLPDTVVSASTLRSFQHQLKTFLFQRSLFISTVILVSQ